MNRQPLIPLHLMLVLAPVFLWAADPTEVQPSPASTSVTNPNPMVGGTIQVPPDNWTALTGTVQAVNPTAQVVQLKDMWGKLLQVTLDKHVKIEKEGKPVPFSQIRPGDVITLSRRNKS